MLSRMLLPRWLLALACLAAPLGAHEAGAQSGYNPLTPCRAIDTRSGSPLVGQTSQDFTVKGTCGVPANATAISYNVTIVSPQAPGFLTLHAAGTTRPAVSALNFQANKNVGNGGVVPLKAGAGNDLTIYLATSPAGQTGHVILDVTGFFDPVM
jgi:hypothetical protein